MGGSHGDLAQALALAMMVQDQGGTAWGQAAVVGGESLGVREALSGASEEPLSYSMDL